jgi:hypothetical protein
MQLDFNRQQALMQLVTFIEHISKQLNCKDSKMPS